jgi:hypothetical protein
MRFLIVFLLLASVAFAAVATPVNVSSLSVSAGVVTVAASGHGLSVGQGFCLSAPASFCGVVTAQNASGFTFNSTTVIACASSCGTVIAAKQIVALIITQPPNQVASFVCWLQTASPAPRGGGGSSWSGATAPENAAIAAGTTVEVQQTYPVVPGTTLTDFKNYAQRTCSNLQTQLNSGVAPGFLLGNYFDGVGWLQ